MAHSGESHIASRINNGVHGRKNQQFCHQVRHSRIKLAKILPSQQSTMKVRNFPQVIQINGLFLLFFQNSTIMCHLSQVLIFAALIAVAMAAYEPAAKTEEIVEVVEPVTIN